VDKIADEFEDAWNRGKMPAIRDFVQDAQGIARGVLLMELVKIDMEYRWVCKDRRTAQDYCQEFPELSWPDNRVPNELETREEQLRNRYGDTTDTAAAGDTVTAVPPAGDDAPFGGKLGAYTIIRELGRGGMGTVYEATRNWDNLRVALKVLRRTLMDEPVYVGRFLREAQSAANLHHPNIVEVHEIGQATQHYYFSMEFVDGESLRKRLCRQEKLSAKEALGLMLQAARGLAYAWERGIVHRDVKPSNLMIRKDGVLKVTDLGLARYSEVTGELTESGESLGTPAYMAPEQVLNAKHADFRADIYSFGATFYQALTGRTPFVGATPLEIIRQLQHDQPRPVRGLAPEVPEHVAYIVETMLAKDPKERYQSAGELLSALETAGASP
jgi:serine/threonine-protein kinase